MTAWSLSEQLNLVHACQRVLDHYPRMSLRRPPVKLGDVLHCEFLELCGNSSRTKDATLAGCRSLVKKFERERNLRASKAQRTRSSKQDTEAESSVDDQVFDAVAELVRTHPTCVTRATRKRRARMKTPAPSIRTRWSPSELEVLGRALVDMGPSLESVSQLHTAFLARGGFKKRSPGAVMAAARKMTKARAFVLLLDECQGSWETWLNLPDGQKRELVVGKSWRNVLALMNRNALIALDETAVCNESVLDGDNDDEMASNNTEPDEDADAAGSQTEGEVDHEQRGASWGGADQRDSAAPRRQVRGEVEASRACDPCSSAADNKVDCLLQAALGFAEIADNMQANAAASHAKELKTLYPVVLQALAGRDDEGCENVKQIFQNHAAYLEESSSLLNAQREGEADLVARALRKGLPPVEEEQE
jgi:hypothetical protein